MSEDPIVSVYRADCEDARGRDAALERVGRTGRNRRRAAARLARFEQALTHADRTIERCAAGAGAGFVHSARERLATLADELPEAEASLDAASAAWRAAVAERDRLRRVVARALGMRARRPALLGPLTDSQRLALDTGGELLDRVKLERVADHGEGGRG